MSAQGVRNFLFWGFIAGSVAILLFFAVEIGRFIWASSAAVQSAEYGACVEQLEAVTHPEVHGREISLFCRDRVTRRSPDLEGWAKLASGYVGPLSPQEFTAQWLGSR